MVFAAMDERLHIKKEDQSRVQRDEEDVKKLVSTLESVMLTRLSKEATEEIKLRFQI